MRCFWFCPNREHKSPCFDSMQAAEIALEEHLAIPGSHVETEVMNQKRESGELLREVIYE